MNKILLANRGETAVRVIRRLTSAAAASGTGAQGMIAPMPGKIAHVPVAAVSVVEGQSVEAGAMLLVVE